MMTRNKIMLTLLIIAIKDQALFAPGDEFEPEDVVTEAPQVENVYRAAAGSENLQHGIINVENVAQRTVEPSANAGIAQAGEVAEQPTIIARRTVGGEQGIPPRDGAENIPARRSFFGDIPQRRSLTVPEGDMMRRGSTSINALPTISEAPSTARTDIMRRGSTVAGLGDTTRGFTEATAGAQAMNPLPAIPEIPTLVPNVKVPIQTRMSRILNSGESSFLTSNEMMASSVRGNAPLEEAFNTYKTNEAPIIAEKQKLKEQMQAAGLQSSNPLPPEQQEKLQQLNEQYRARNAEQEKLQNEMKKTIARHSVTAPAHEPTAEPTETSQVRRPAEGPPPPKNPYKGSGYEAVMERLNTMKTAPRVGQELHPSEIPQTRSRSGAVTHPTPQQPPPPRIRHMG